MHCVLINVHPNYRRLGYGTALIRWGQAVSQADRVDHWAVSSNMANPFFRSLAYLMNVVQVPGEGNFEAFIQFLYWYSWLLNREQLSRPPVEG